ncbi:MAG: ABC transporter ATP-binding protein [Planctomycetales bacterium]|nr:ABC transporter ATP-binding protein [Planctomycetales bacterium]
MSDSILIVNDLHTHFKTDDGLVKAVDGVSFSLKPGETLGLVGESGSGKSVTCLSVMRLIDCPPGCHPSGTVHFHGQDLLRASESELQKIRGNRISMIFQDPMTSLNPFLKVGRQLTEVLELHQGLSPSQSAARAIEMLDRVGIPSPRQRFDQYPHEFSGGMRQRVMIAMALLCEPELLIADEPTTALDVTIQAQILDLIANLKKDFGTSVILITHDLGVVAGTTDRVAVMYAGKIVEHGTTSQVFETPMHPYTKGLLNSVPRLDDAKEKLYAIPGLPPDLSELPPGCPFHPRCGAVAPECQATYPGRVTRNETHWADCSQIEH